MPKNFNRQDVIDILKNAMPYLRKEYGVLKVGLFGSFANDITTEESDVDLLLHFEKPTGLKYFDLIYYLEDILGRNVDIITPDGLNSIRVDGIAYSIESRVKYV